MYTDGQFLQDIATFPFPSRSSSPLVNSAPHSWTQTEVLPFEATSGLPLSAITGKQAPFVLFLRAVAPFPQVPWVWAVRVSEPPCMTLEGPAFPLKGRGSSQHLFSGIIICRESLPGEELLNAFYLLHLLLCIS